MKTPLLEARCSARRTKSFGFHNRTAPQCFSGYKSSPLASSPTEAKGCRSIFSHALALPGFSPPLVPSGPHQSCPKPFFLLLLSLFQAFPILQPHGIFRRLAVTDLVPVSKIIFQTQKKKSLLDATGSAAFPLGGTAPPATRLFCHRNMTNASSTTPSPTRSLPT